MKKRILLIVFLFIFMIPFTAKAETIAQKRKEIANLNAQYQAKQNQKSQAKNEIKTDEQSIKTKQYEITVNQQKVTDAENESEQLTKDIADSKEELNKLMNAYQKAQGDNLYLEYIFEATSYEDLVYRYAVMEQIMGYMNGKINEYKDKIQKNEELKVYIADRQVQLNNQIASLNEDIDALYDNIKQYDLDAVDIKDDINDAEQFLQWMINMGCKETEELSACQARVNSTNNIGWTKPLVKGKVGDGYGSRTLNGSADYHYGTDLIGNPEGTSVYPVASGTVCKIQKQTSCGGNKVFVCSYVNGKKYTTVYMHLLSIKVSLYQTVYTNTVIATVGGGAQTSAKVKPYTGYDQCSYGAHLHVGIATGWYGSDYTAYSTFKARTVDPAKTMGLPKRGVWWYSRY